MQEPCPRKCPLIEVRDIRKEYPLGEETVVLAVLLLLGGCTGSCRDTEAVSTAQPSISPTPEVEQSAEPTPSAKPSPTPTARPTAMPEPTATPESSVAPTPIPTAYDCADLGLKYMKAMEQIVEIEMGASRFA